MGALGGEDEFGGGVGETEAGGGVGAPSEWVAEAVAAKGECLIEIWDRDLDGVDGADQWVGHARGASRWPRRWRRGGGGGSGW